MFHHSSTDHEAPVTPENTAPRSAIRPDGSYEIVFSNTPSSNTDYTANGYNAYGFSANGSRRETSGEPLPTDSAKGARAKKRISLPLALVVVSSCLALASLVLSITLLVTRHTVEPPVFGTRPLANETVKPLENNTVTIPTDAYAQATAQTIHSVVVITTEGGSGSGVVWASGTSYSYIVTCHHVVDGESEIMITFHNGEECYAEIVGSDARTDIAVLRVNLTGLHAITLPNENTEMMLGQAVIAIGNPLGVLGNSVSDGILSSLTRTVSIEGATMDLLQTTAAVNHGNSGGGLFDLNGQLIGIVNAKISETSVEGIGFAIPVNTLKTIAGELIDKGYVTGRPTLGVGTWLIDSKDAFYAATDQYPDLKDHATYRDIMGTRFINGLFVVDPSTVAGYPEGAATLLFGDRITAIGSVTINTKTDLQTALNSYNAGDTVQIAFVRQNKTYVTEIILAAVGK